MQKSNINLDNLLARVSEEKMDIATENTGDAKASQTSWGWSAAQNKSWNDQSWSWDK